MLVQWLKLTTEDLRSRLFNMAISGEATDVKIVCQDGHVWLHRPVLDLYLPEVTNWIPAYHTGFDLVIHLLGKSVNETVIAVRQVYLDDNCNELRTLFGLSQSTKLKRQQFKEQVEEEEESDQDEENYDDNEEPLMQEDDEDEEPLLPAALVKMETSDIPEQKPLDPGDSIPTSFLLCPGCDQGFTSTACLQYHEIKVHNSTTLTENHRCNQHSKLSFNNFQELKEHFKVHHSNIKGSDRFKEIEEEEMKLIDSITLDISIPDDTKLSCRTCMRLKKRESLIEFHNHYQLMHTPIQCPKCGKQCPNRSALNKHIIVHDENREKNVLCTLCGMKFHLKGTLSQHMRRVHEGQTFKCDQCPKIFKSTSQLRDHIENKHTEITYTCATCGKTCQSRWLWKSHMRIHTAVKKHACDYCDKLFRSKEKLRDHQSVHTNIKYPCTICGSQFSRIPTLKAHMRIHNDPYKCPECSKIFETGQKYREHMNTHTGAKPFKCDACQSAYSSSSSLSHHKKSCSLYINLLQQRKKEEPI